MSESSASYVFFVGDDDFLVERDARTRWATESADASDEMSKEIIEGTAIRVDDVTEIVSRFAEAVETIPLFGGKKYVWLRNVNWLSDNVLGASKKTEDAVERLADIAKLLDRNAVFAMVSVIKPDKRRTVAKKFFKCGEMNTVGDGKIQESLYASLDATAHSLGVKLGPDATRVLMEKVNNHSRMAHVELEKLACYVGTNGTINSETVRMLVPEFGEVDFFEAGPVYFFFSGDLRKTLDSLHSYFFNHNKSARELLVAMQKRVSLLIQIRVLLDAGDVRQKSRGEISQGAISIAEEKYAAMFGGISEKSHLNLFSQNTWYVGTKVAPTLSLPGMTLRRLIDWKLDFLDAFEQLISRPNEEEAVMCELVTRCLGY